MLGLKDVFIVEKRKKKSSEHNCASPVEGRMQQNFTTAADFSPAAVVALNLWNLLSAPS